MNSIPGLFFVVEKEITIKVDEKASLTLYPGHSYVLADVEELNANSKILDTTTKFEYDISYELFTKIKNGNSDIKFIQLI